MNYMNNMNESNSETSSTSGPSSIVSASFQQQMDELGAKISDLNEKFFLQNLKIEQLESKQKEMKERLRAQERYTSKDFFSCVQSPIRSLRWQIRIKQHIEFFL